MTGEEFVPETNILPLTSIEYPAPILTEVPEAIERTSPESTEYPSGRTTVPDHTVVDRESAEETRLENGTNMSISTNA